MESGVILVGEKTTFRSGETEMCLEATDPWVAGCVKGFGQVPRMVIMSHSLGLHT